ncbi:MAG: DUF2723 domain-containing protein [Caldisericia bacterium]|nr:DUF2723 domain-containing protein [Caldisericia bacterium]
MNKKININVFLLTLITILTRIFLFKDFFHEWDTINFALAIKNFNVYAEQPHPPGYPIPVLISKFVYLFIKDDLKSLQILSLFFSILGVLIFYYFMKILTQDEFYSFLTTIIFSFTSIFYFYGTVEDIYSSEAFLTLILGLFSFLSLKDKKYLPILSIFYGLSTGIRFNDLIFFFPLIIFVFIKSKIKLKELIFNCSLIIFFVLICYLPTVYSGGGFDIHSIHSKTLFTWVIGTSLIFNNQYWLTKTFETFILFLRESLIPIFFLIFLFFKKRDFLLFFLTWITPSFLFYLFIHAPKVGYYLTIIPPIYIFLFYKFYNLKIKYKKFIFITLVIILILNTMNIFIDLRKDLNNQIEIISVFINKIQKFIKNDNDIIIISDETVSLFRHIPYYIPYTKTYFLTAHSNYISEWNIEYGYIIQQKREPMEICKGNIIKIGENVKKLIFITQSPRELEDILILDNVKIEESIGSIRGGGFTIVSYEITDDFDYLLFKGFKIIKN